jgi:hypothetical protein
MTLAIAVGMGLTLAALGIGSVYVRRGVLGASSCASGASRGRLGLVLALGGPLFITALGVLLFVGSW